MKFEPDTSTARSFGAVVPGLDCKGSGNAKKLNEVKARWTVDLGTIHGVLSVLPLLELDFSEKVLALAAKKDSKTLLRLLNFTFNSVCVSYRLLNLYKATEVALPSLQFPAKLAFTQ